MRKIIDSHIHLDMYEERETERIIGGLETTGCTDLISVSFHLDSCMKNLQLSERYQEVRPAFGFHPEQQLPADHQLADLISWMERHREKMSAVGEVGLPYYLRQERGSAFNIKGYVELLEEFIKRAKAWEKPVILHAVYDDAPVVCDLLEKHDVTQAHFHWFKGDSKTIDRMIANGYFVSFTPDVVYEQEIQKIVQAYPVDQMMVETDGPWRFEGPFEGKITHPAMIHEAVSCIASLKGQSLDSVYNQLYQNTVNFYRLERSR